METEKIISKIAKWSNYSKDPESVIFDELDSISDRLEAIVAKLEPMDLSEAHTIQGDDGYTPVKGDDYLTDEELDAIKEEILEEATPIYGVDYFTDEEKEDFLSKLTLVKGVHFDDGVQGIQGIQGIDGISPTLEDIKTELLKNSEFLESIKGEKGDISKIDAQSIADNLNTLPNSIDFKVIKGLSDKLAQSSQGTISSKRIKVLIGGVEQSEPLGSINFTSGITHVGQDYKFSGGGITAWTANTAYLANDIVYFGTNIYKRIANGTSGTTFDATEEAFWNVMGSTGTIAPWSALSYYEVGEVVTNSGTIYRTITTHTSAATFDTAEAATFSVIANYVDTKTWVISTYYPAGTLTVLGDRIIKRTTAGTSGTVFDSTEAAFYTVVKHSDTTWSANTFYFANDKAIQNGVIYSRTANGTSLATFSVTEEGLWTRVGTVGNGSVKTVTSSYALTNVDEQVFINSSSGALTISLPVTLPEGKFFTVTYTQTANAITFAGSGATVISPSTYLPVTSFVAPGTVGQVGSTQFYRIGTIFYFNG